MNVVFLQKIQMDKRKLQVPEIGTKFGHWEVIDNEKVNRGSKPYLLCKCSCGRESLVGLFRLLRGFTSSCKKCSPGINKQHLGKGKHKGVGLIPRTLFGKIQRSVNSKHRKGRHLIKFDLTIEQIWELFLKQEGKCALSGIELVLHCSHIPIKDKRYFSYMTASLDRIDSNKDYTIDNVQWVHKWVNIMKNTLINDEFLYLCNLIYNKNKDNFEPSLVNIDFLEKVTRKVQRLTDEDTISDKSDTSIRHPEEG